MPDSSNPYAIQIRDLMRRYADHGLPRHLEAARTLLVAMAIEQGLTAYDVEAMTALVARA